MGTFRKFLLIFGRNVLFLRRNPKIIVAIFTNSVYFGLVLVAVFFHVGWRYDTNTPEYATGDGRFLGYGKEPNLPVWIGNWVGIA